MITITKTVNPTNTIHHIDFEEPCKDFLLSLIKTQIFVCATINISFTKISFQANTIVSLYDFMKENNISYENAIKMVSNLSKQIEKLQKTYNKTFSTFVLKYIYVIDDNKFIYLNPEDIYKIKEDNTIKIHKLFKNSKEEEEEDRKEKEFISLEMSEIKMLPGKIHYKSIYYSLALLILYFLNIEENEIIKIKDTKLYWFLIRCLNKDPKNRILLYI